ncbi:unnamed protein product [Cyclocybe aegerita]|uniref:Uncharacterized protein n=1 Tax=Cyclocybe aegerita TaxID=1973307 RepID=A0A8S0XX96_CYCAE|nr:unnamed protein product [Cyclocybe aegerita]
MFNIIDLCSSPPPGTPLPLKTSYNPRAGRIQGQPLSHAQHLPSRCMPLPFNRDGGGLANKQCNEHQGWRSGRSRQVYELRHSEYEGQTHKICGLTVSLVMPTQPPLLYPIPGQSALSVPPQTTLVHPPSITHGNTTIAHFALANTARFALGPHLALANTACRTLANTTHFPLATTPHLALAPHPSSRPH